MMGEIEEPSGLDFKINSGSISFGRFESESLCWERRSSFSHNRYLEEVERYSKPGSVTEKKAYFEAHFKKKGILSLLSPGIQNRTNSENEEDNRTNEDIHSPSTDESWIDDRSLTSEKVKDATECGGADEVFEPKIELPCHDSDGSGCVSEAGDLFSENSLLHESEVKENLNGKTSDLGCQLPESNSERIRSNDCPDYNQEKSQKEKVLLGDESLPKPRSVAGVKTLKGRRNASGEVSKTSERKPSKTVIDVRSKKTSENAETVKPRTISTKVHPIKRVEKEPRNRVVKPHSSAQRETLSKVHQTVKRVVPVSNLSRPKQENPKITNHKISEVADQRKKEKTESELKQSRKGLNFKARPLPSFYRRASQESDMSKDVADNAKLQSQRCNNKSPLSNGITVSENSPLISRQRKAQNRVN